MPIPAEELPAGTKRDTFLAVSLSLLVVFTVVFLFAAFSTYRHRIQAVSLSESRFVRTEWHLLRDLKAQTDQELLEKDQQIADLNRRYLSLVRRSASQAEIQRIESLLRQAEAQREAILERRASAQVETPDQPRPERQQPTAWIGDLLPSGSGSALSRILQNRIDALEAQLKESRSQSEELANENVALRARLSQASRTETGAIGEYRAEASRLASASAREDASVARLLEEVRRKMTEAGEEASPTIKELDTRVLVRAIIGSPEIRARYPDLLASLDRYLAAYAREERAKGRQEAYSSIEALAKQQPPEPAR